MKKLPIPYLLIFLLLLGCDPMDKKIRLINISKSNIYYSRSCSDSLSDLFKDEYKKGNIDQYYTNYVEKLAPDSTIYDAMPGNKKAWERYINSCDDSLLRILTFDFDTLKTYSWEKIIKERKYKKIYKYSVSDLEKVNWNVELSSAN